MGKTLQEMLSKKNQAAEENSWDGLVYVLSALSHRLEHAHTCPGAV